jgi:hypothetical protein
MILLAIDFVHQIVHSKPKAGAVLLSPKTPNSFNEASRFYDENQNAIGMLFCAETIVKKRLGLSRPANCLTVCCASCEVGGRPACVSAD